MSAAAPAAPAAPVAAAANAAATATTQLGKAGSFVKDNWGVVGALVIGMGILAGNIVLLKNMAGSSDSWDTIKSQLGGSIGMSFAGAAFLSIAMCLYFASYNVGAPIYILVILVNVAMAMSLSAMSVAAMTR